MADYKQYFSWRSAMMKSELDAPTKHVLLTLSTYMNDWGQGAFPSVGELCESTSLSDRCVRDQLIKAVEAGWIDRSLLGLSGAKWKCYKYQLKWPAGCAALSDSDRQDVPERPAPDAGTDRQDVPTNSPIELTNQLTNQKQKQSAKTADTAFDLPDWIPQKQWSEYEKMRRKIHKPMTEYAKSLAVSKLLALKHAGYAPGDVLDQSSLNDWQGLFEVHRNGHKRNGEDHSGRYDYTELMKELEEDTSNAQQQEMDS